MSEQNPTTTPAAEPEPMTGDKKLQLVSRFHEALAAVVPEGHDFHSEDVGEALYLAIHLRGQACACGPDVHIELW